MKKRVEKNRGITLVALVVTIVVLLILAGITITMLFSDNGIIRKAQEASNKTAEDAGNTTQGLQNLSNQLNNALGQNGGGSGDDGNVKTVNQGEKVPEGTLYSNFVAKTDDNKDINVPVPGGYTVVENFEKSNKVNDGIVIQDESGNQFVWIPVPDPTTMYGTDSSGKKHGKLYDILTGGRINLNWTETGTTTKVMNITDAASYCEPNILTSTAYGDASTGTEDTEYNGIEQLKNVIGISAVGEGTTEKDKVLNNWIKELEDKFDEMIASVEKYKGFYIGRYETGNWNTAGKKPSVKEGQTVVEANWYEQYAETKNLKANNNVTTSMMWGCQFDRVIEWIADTCGGYSLIESPKTWGNYLNSEDSAQENSRTLQTSGKNSNWRKNNIYDLAGNAEEWTIEVTNEVDAHIMRGGSYIDSADNYYILGERRNRVPFVGTDVSSRATLYINLKAESDTK